MSGLKKTRRDGREEPIALDDEMFRVMPEDEPSGPPERDAPELDDDPDMTLEEDDLMPEPQRRSGRGRAVWVTLLALVVVAVSGLAAWVALTPGPTVSIRADEAEVVVATPTQPASTALPSLPTVRAEEGPFKFRPDDPGGLRVENMDRRVYEQVGEDARVDGADDVEQLLPAPSPPVAPPVPEPAPAPLTAMTTVTADEAATPVPDAPEDAGSTVAAAEAEVPPEPEPEPAGDDATATTAPEPEPEAAPAAPAENVALAVENGPLIQLAAFKERAQAERQWESLRDAHGDLLGRIAPVIVYADLGDLGQFYRLRAGPLADVGAAEALCRDLRRRDVECLVVRD
ncbi:SPOR domain-containing protein [Rhodospira trueperi]|uniref:Cell division protein DedD (Protein involved in septation) n=1 Tax=Rhodospira trueperi TaxID=69960 RepID=A0A1G6WKP0_9PROT|nr:SPOR domain-containing protein [Rhodospira trueperi]SDD66462.1 Cell division protein DedD (protein involved in septation) [Rhodospira trueperi]